MTLTIFTNFRTLINYWANTPYLERADICLLQGQKEQIQKDILSSAGNAEGQDK